MIMAFSAGSVGHPIAAILLLGLAVTASAQLSATFYDASCPSALATIKSAVTAAVNNEPRMGASLLRLHFHDCFVQGCDASVLLNDTASFTGEQTAFPNRNSIRGLNVIDNVKAQVEAVCAQTVSCADILTVAARDSIVALGGPSYTVPLGRRDSTTASLSEANRDLPPPTSDLADLVGNFSRKGLSVTDMVALSGAHTIGRAACLNFRSRIYGDSNIAPAYAASLQANCPQSAPNGDGTLAPLDVSTPDSFDNAAPLAAGRRRRRRHALAMAHLRLLLSHSRCHPHPHHLLPLLRFCSSNSSNSPPPPIKPVSYAPKPQPPPAEAPSSEAPSASPDDSLPRRFQQQPQPQNPPRQFTRQEMRFANESGPAIAPVSYPSRVAPLPEDRPAAGEEGVNEEDLRGEGERIEKEAQWGRRPIFGLQVEEETVPYPTLIPVVKRPQKVAIDLVDALREIKASANEKKRNFTETVEAHVMLGVDPRRGDQMVRGAITLPHGTGKTVRVAVFAEGPAAEEARAAGADVVGGDELIEEIRKGGGKLSFDKCIATPMYMPRLSKVARILGPRGLMPNPKLGSVTNDVSGAVKAAKSGRVDFKIDKTAIVHVGLGKVNFSEESLRENIGAFVNALLLAKPVGLKKTSKYVGYVKKFTLSSTMGPGFSVTIPSLSAAADNYTKVQVN